MQKVWWVIGSFAAVLLIYNLVKLLFQATINMSINRADVKAAQYYDDLCMKVEYKTLEDEEFRDKLVKTYKTMHPNVFLDTISALCASTVKIIGFSYIIASVSPVVLLVLVAVIIAIFFVNRKKSKNEYNFTSTLAEYTRRLDYTFNVMAIFDYAKEVRINNVSKILDKKSTETINHYDQKRAAFLNKQFFLDLIAAILTLVQMLASYGYAVYEVAVGIISVGSFSAFITAIQSFTQAFNDLTAQLGAVRNLSNYVSDYLQFMTESEPSQTGKIVLPLPTVCDELPMFSFENVSFQYPNTDNVVLKDISIKINKGDKLSIVGPNGAGKSTFIKLLCRLYEPTHGVIKYYGKDISTIDEQEYSKILAVVFQDFKVFSFSFMENIVLNQELDEKRLDEAIKKAGLMSRVHSLPNGIKTNIYKDFDENGIELSGGEGQKVAIARAYYKDAEMLILDEPTAALDAEAENEIYSKFYEIIKDKTSVFISHRLASTRFCDHIAVFSDGKITQYGNHSELMKQDGLYRKMFLKQAEHYLEKTEE